MSDSKPKSQPPTRKQFFGTLKKVAKKKSVPSKPKTSK